MSVRPRYVRKRHFLRVRHSEEFLTWLAEQAEDYSVISEEVFEEFLKAQRLTFEQIEDGQAVPSARTIAFGLIGQSNMVGTASNDGGTTYPTGTLFYTESGGFEVASGPLPHIGGNGSGEPSIGLGFALAYAAANPLDTIVLIPCASGGTGFFGNDWNPGDVLYNQAINRMNACLAADSKVIFGGFLWHQGENDGINNASSTYQNSLTTMVSQMRSDVTGASAETPFVVGNLREDFNLGEVAQIRTILADAPNFLDYAGFAASSGLTGSDDRHFNASGLRTLGDRYYPAFILAQADVPSAPSQVQNLNASGSDGQVALTWDNTPNATGYRVSRSVVDGGPYSLINSPTGNSFTDTSVINGTTYYYIVEATNAVGTGPASSQSSATPDVSSGLAVLSSDYAYISDNSGTTVQTASNLTTTDGQPHIVVAHGVGATPTINIAPSSLTLGGQSGTLIGSAINPDGGVVTMWLVGSVSGVLNDVVLTFPTDQARFTGVGVFSLDAAPTVSGTSSDTSVSATFSSSVNIDVSLGGLILAACSTRGSGTTPSIAFASEASGVGYSEFPSVNLVIHAAAIEDYAGAVTNETVTFTWVEQVTEGVVLALALEP